MSQEQEARLEGPQLTLLTGHAAVVHSLAFSPDGLMLASAAGDRSVILWDLPTGTMRLRLEGLLEWGSSITFSPDGTGLITTSSHATYIWEVATGRPLRVLAGVDTSTQDHDPFQSVVRAVSQCGRWIAEGTRQGTVTLRAWPSGTVIREIAAHPHEVTAIAFSPDGKTLATAGYDRATRLWSTATGECLQELISLRDEVLTATFGPDEGSVASGHEDGTLRLWNANTGSLRNTFHCEHWRVAAVTCSADGGRILTASHTPGDAGALELWDPAAGDRSAFFEIGPGWIDRVSFVPHSDLAVVSRMIPSRRNDEDVTLGVDLGTGTERYLVKGFAAAVSPDGRLLATTTGRLHTGVIHLWNAANGQWLRDLARSPTYDWYSSLTFTPDGRQLIAGFDGHRMGLWDVECGEQLWETRVLRDANGAVAFSPDGRWLAIGGGYGYQVSIWDLAARQEHVILTGHLAGIRSLEFSSDGARLVSASADGTIKLWCTRDWQLLATLLILPTTDDTVPEDWITFTPSGHYLGSPGAEALIRWQTDTELLPAHAFRTELLRPERMAAGMNRSHPSPN